ncbi:winged helix-turn-helix transcriptional regulator [Nonomuraea sp. B10E15]|uniref:winged helix-turn-helix transcriptional regulator n=1 Tax=Nonomuraea sp. B10E15 TaxID=3153560 RepID=UPI00325D2E17
MVGRRKYDDGCAVAHGLDLVGERWALLIVRELLLGPKRFTHLRAGLPGASPDVLSQRLRQLQESGVVRHRRLPPPAGVPVYELTEWGMGLEPVVTGLGRWAGGSSSLPLDAPIGVDSLILSLKALFDPGPVGDVEIRATVRLGGDEFRVTAAGGEIAIARGGVEHPDITLDTDAATFASLLRGVRSPEEAVVGGDLRVDGDVEAAVGFLALFRRAVPPPGPEATRAE